MLKLKVARPLATAAVVVFTFLTAPVPAAAELACGSPPEGFESGLPAGWTSAGNSPVTWGTLAACGEAGNFTGGLGDAACVSGSLADPGAIEAELRTSSFSLAGVTTARLEMRLNYQHFAAGDSLDLEISDDGGQSWTLLRHDQRDRGAFAIADGDRVEVDLSDFADGGSHQLDNGNHRNRRNRRNRMANRMFKLSHLYFSILLRPMRFRKKELIAAVFLALFLVMALPSAGDEREVGPLAGPQAVISPYHFTDSEEESYGYGDDPWKEILFYNPTGVRVPTAEGEKFLMFVQTERSALSHPDADEGKQIQWTCGDKVVLFESDWSYEGLRTKFRVKKTISPCWCDNREPCPEGCRCTDEQLSSFGAGSVIKSEHDGKYYIFLDRSLGPNPTETEGDFKDVWVFVSEDGYNWDDTPLINPLVQKSTVSGVPIQIWDVTLAAGDGKWWGLFRWYWPPDPPPLSLREDAGYYG